MHKSRIVLLFLIAPPFYEHFQVSFLNTSHLFDLISSLSFPKNVIPLPALHDKIYIKNSFPHLYKSPLQYMSTDK